MTPSRAWVGIAALLLLLPTALADDPFRASEVELHGTTVVSGDAYGALLRADALEFSFTVTAQSAHLVREFADVPLIVDHPLNPEILYARQDDWQREESDFTDVSISPRGVLAGGALVVLADAAALEGSAEGPVAVKSVQDPVLSQGPPPTTENAAGDAGEIVAEVPGEFLQMSLGQAALTLAGDLTLILHGPSYLLEGAEGSFEGRTGEFETARQGPVAQGRQERHTLTLVGATLTLHAPDGAQVLSAYPLLDFSAGMNAKGARGELTLAGTTLVPSDDGSVAYIGAGALQLGLADGLVGAQAPAALATTGVAVDQGPRLLTLTAAGIAVLVALGFAGALLWRRRARPDDDLALALLAMEERRWDDALTPLARVAKARPNDANVLVDRALCLEQVGRYDEAARGFEAALRAAPRHAEAHFYYARTLAKMREKEAARVHLETALERDPRLVEMARGEAVLRGL